jgi:putative hydrolase of the HAD superfamily
VDEPVSVNTKEGMSITTLVFDFGNVLGLFSHRKAAEQLAAYGGTPEHIQAFFFTGDLEDTFELGRIAPSAYANLVRDACRLSCTDEQFRAAFADMFTLNESVCALVPHLKRRYRLLLLSNTNALHAAQFRSQFATTLGHFDALVLSHEVGLRKPDRRIYEHCRGVAGRPAHECLFIDDLEANVAAARACGWKGLHYSPGEDLVPRLAAHGIVVSE